MNSSLGSGGFRMSPADSKKDVLGGARRLFGSSRIESPLVAQGRLVANDGVSLVAEVSRTSPASSPEPSVV